MTFDPLRYRHREYRLLTEEQRCALDEIFVRYPHFYVLAVVFPNADSRFHHTFVKIGTDVSELNSRWAYFDWNGTVWTLDDTSSALSSTPELAT